MTTEPLDVAPKVPSVDACAVLPHAPATTGTVNNSIFLTTDFIAPFPTSPSVESFHHNGPKSGALTVGKQGTAEGVHPLTNTLNAIRSWPGTSFLRRLRGGSSERSDYGAPPGQRIYAVGDVHGCARELDQLLSAIAIDCSETDLDTQLVFLGDLVDRGPASAEVIARLCTADLPIARHAFLMGNHEEVMLAVYDGDVERLDGWLRYGGMQTLESYGISREDILRIGLDLPALMRERIPADHVLFIRGLRDLLQVGDYLFVHAGIRPGIAVEDQNASDLRWMRRGFLDDGTDHGLIVVHGHTISSEPELRRNRIGIDTGCYKSGTLTALVLEGTNRRFITNR